METSKPAAKKPPPEAASKALKDPPPQKYYGLRKCPGLETPAIFMCINDVQKHLHNLTKKQRDTVEYGEFDSIVDAAKFIHEPESERDMNSLSRPPPPLPKTSDAIDPEIQSRLAAFDAATAKLVSNSKKRSRTVVEGGYETATKKVKGTTIRIISNSPRKMSNRELEWETNYQLLLRFRQVYGDCNVPTVKDHPRITPEFEGLPSWVQKVQSQLERFEEEEDDDDDDNDEDNEDKSSANNTDGGSKKSGRKKYKRLLTQDRKDRLELLGFRAETTKGINWDKSFEILKRFKEMHGDCAVPTSATHPRILADPEFKTLIKWVRKVKGQLKAYDIDPKSSKIMTAGRRQKLKDIGFFDESDDNDKAFGLRDKNWEAKFQMLEEYKLKFGNCDIPQNSKHVRFQQPGNAKFKALISWTSRTREILEEFEKNPDKKGVMNAERKQRLIDIGFHIKPVRKAGQKFSNDGELFATREKKYNERFEEMFQKLKEYRAEHGHVNIPMRPNNPVRNWLMTQRSMYEQSLQGKKVPLTLQKMAQLQALGFQFVPANRKKSTEERIEDW
jgi:hypothetical protein